MNQSTRSTRRASALVSFAIVLIAGGTVAAIASYYLVTASGSSARDQLSTAVAGGRQSQNVVSSSAIGCREVSPADGSDSEVPNFACTYANQDNTVRASASGSPATATTTICHQIGVDQGDGEYGPLPIYNCQTTRPWPVGNP